jgi:hypothetical protein
MTIQILNKELGFYEPSFFFMKIQSSLSPEKILKEKKEIPTFIHEYIHFLQDITTVSGLQYINYVYNILQACVYIANQSKSRVIEIPIDISGISNLDLAKDLNSLFIGDSHECLNCTNIRSIDNEPNGLIKGFENSSYVTINFDSGKNYHFGVIAIKETMAYIIEKKLFPHCIKSPNIPYLLGKMVVEYIYPVLNTSDDNIVALCDASLMYDNPAEIFYSSLQLMKDEKLYFDTPNMVYDFIFNNVKYEKGKDVNWRYDKAKGELLRTLPNIFGHDNYFSKECEWLVSVINDSYSIRVSKPYFIIDILNEKEGLSTLVNYMEKIGLPLIFNEKDEAAVFDKEGFKDKVDFGLFRAFFEIFDILKTDIVGGNFHYQCNLYNFCKTAKENLTDNYCKLSPWEKVHSDKLCPFAKLWHRWGLSDKSIKK